MARHFLLSALAAAMLAGSAHAATVVPVSVTASNTFSFWGEYKAANLINGSGLSGGLHDSNYANMWMTDLGVNSASLVFDLGQAFDLSEISLWNYNFGTPGYLSTLERGVQDFSVELSLDGLSYQSALSGQLGVGGGQPLAAETFGLNGKGRFVKLLLSSNHVSDPAYVRDSPIGLSEVRFSGAAVPEPMTWALMIMGFAAVGGALRRQRTVAFAI